MAKYNFNELMEMDTESLTKLREKAWDARDVMNSIAMSDKKPILYSSDICRIFSEFYKTTAIIGAAYIGYRAVKYLVDHMYPKENINE